MFNFSPDQLLSVVALLMTLVNGIYTFLQSRHSEGERIARLEGRVDMIHDFILRRSVGSMVNSGVATMNSPLQVTDAVKLLFEPLKVELQKWYSETAVQGDIKLEMLELDNKFGDTILSELTMKHGIEYGSALLLAIAIASGDDSIEVPFQISSTGSAIKVEAKPTTSEYAIFLLDTEGTVATWNLTAERMKGYTAAEILGKHFSIFYLPEDIEKGKPAEELKVALHEGRVEDIGWRVRKDGTRFFAKVIITALRDKQGTLRGFSKITSDITDSIQGEVGDEV